VILLPKNYSGILFIFINFVNPFDPFLFFWPNPIFGIGESVYSKFEEQIYVDKY